MTPTVLDADSIFAVVGPYVYAFSLVLVRIAALVATTPIFSAPAIPIPSKMGLVGVLTLLVMVSTGPMPAPGPLEPVGLTGAVLSEAIVGGTMGLAVMVLFGALAFTGQLVGIQMGFAIANVVDPTTFQQVGVVAQVLNLLGLMLFLVFDGHLLMLRALFDSFELVPLGGAVFQTGPIVGELVRLGSELFSIGLRIALPTVCVVLLVNVGLATIARTVPQVNIFVIGFLFTISLGLLVLGLSLPSTALLFEDLVENAIRTVLRLMHGFAPRA